MAHPHEHTHDAQAHDHDARAHDHGHGTHEHSHGTGIWSWLGHLFHLHGHSQQQQQLAADPVIANNARGIRTVWLALIVLSATTIFQLIIVAFSGSVALLADTTHNLGDALNSLPLLIALYLARRAATRRYTYGFGKAEDVAGVLIVLSILVSAGVSLWQAVERLITPAPISNLGWAAAAAVIGFLGNEVVALLQIRVGREIGSAAMVADGLHARTDGLTSLAVLIAVAGTALGFPIVDPIVGLLIGVAILFIARDALVSIWYRLMDAIEPEVVDAIEQVARRVQGVVAVSALRARWLGHQLQAELHIVVDEELPTAVSHQIGEQVRHALFHAQPHLARIDVHIDPCGHSGHDHHQTTVHHQYGSGTTLPAL